MPYRRQKPHIKAYHHEISEVKTLKISKKKRNPWILRIGNQNGIFSPQQH
jgi:hypothetical protein